MWLKASKTTPKIVIISFSNYSLVISFSNDRPKVLILITFLGKDRDQYTLSTGDEASVTKYRLCPASNICNRSGDREERKQKEKSHYLRIRKDVLQQRICVHACAFILVFSFLSFLIMFIPLVSLDGQWNSKSLLPVSTRRMMIERMWRYCSLEHFHRATGESGTRSSSHAPVFFLFSFFNVCVRRWSRQKR